MKPKTLREEIELILLDYSDDEKSFDITIDDIIKAIKDRLPDKNPLEDALTDNDIIEFSGWNSYHSEVIKMLEGK